MLRGRLQGRGDPAVLEPAPLLDQHRITAAWFRVHVLPTKASDRCMYAGASPPAASRRRRQGHLVLHVLREQLARPSPGLLYVER